MKYRALRSELVRHLLLTKPFFVGVQLSIEEKICHLYFLFKSKFITIKLILKKNKYIRKQHVARHHLIEALCLHNLKY